MSICLFLVYALESTLVPLLALYIGSSMVTVPCLQKMSKLHIICFLGRTDKERRLHRQQSSIYNSNSRRLGPSGRLPARRRDPWPEHLDAPSFHRRVVPGIALAGTKVRPAELCRALLQAVPVLGLR